MKLTIERATLLKALGHVQSVVERRNTIPILSNVLLRAEDQGLTLIATDMDLEIKEGAPAAVEQAGETTVSAHNLYDIVRKLPDGTQVLLNDTGGDGSLVLSAGRARFTLLCLPTEDFPVMAAAALPNHFSIAAADLRALIDRTRFAISTEETRYYLNGIYLHVTAPAEGSPSMLRAVATDGHRLARVELPVPSGAEAIPGCIIPRKTIGELRKLLDEASEEVEVALSDTKIRVAFGPVALTSKLIDGTFPDYERVIPSGNDKMLEVDARAFARAVDRVSTISTEKSRAVKLSIDQGALVLSANSPDNGQATEELEVTYGADALEIGFNSRYLLDITEQITGEGAQFALADGASPTLVRDIEDQSALFVLMPMRV